MPELDPNSAEQEHRHHGYTGTRIPWYVHLMWILFWVFAAAYVLSYVFPALQRAFVPRP